MPLPKPTLAEIEKDKKKYLSCNADMELMLSDLLDLTRHIYASLLKVIKKPEDISVARFKKILYIKATIFNIFISKKLLIDSLFDELEKECSLNMLNLPIDQERLLKDNLCPKYYKSFTVKYPAQEDDEIEEVYYFPIISKEILDIKYPLEILTQVLAKQLQKHNVNIAPRGKAATFFKTDGWLAFFGIVSPEAAITILKKGMLFIDPPDFPDSDSRLHGVYSHVIQEYLISKLLEGGYLGDLTVPGEKDITERELFKADAWLVKSGLSEDVYCLFDIMRERKRGKMQLLDVYPDEVFGFTSPDFLNQYLMLNSFRFPCLSTIFYNQYAQGALGYFNLIPGFNQLDTINQLHYMNIHCTDTKYKNDVKAFLGNNPDSYVDYQQSKDVMMLKRRPQSLFRFSYTYDDSESYIRARKKAESGRLEKKLHVDEVSVVEGPKIE
ncbi:hypothetical protein [Legionella brunensis]|uniref:Uncharacterized protein n=1 Tax=Legionella brunensis TaxID=29422 RepID=A0A0W0SE20_9GAMM|nr:hypothetical protein [Legionella brunensis]KTC81618.1 hypothetical protein Lbru_2138 [Legionella brunensis]